MATVKIGEKYFYKINNTRGRPFVGTAVKKLRDQVDLVNREGDLITVPAESIVGPYELKPHARTIERMKAEKEKEAAAKKRAPRTRKQTKSKAA